MLTSKSSSHLNLWCKEGSTKIPNPIARANPEIIHKIFSIESGFRSIEPGKKPKLFIGESKGTISKRTVGENGFGYDPIFIPDGENRTFAQMETEVKNQFSHRGNSLEKLINYFKNM